MTRVIRVLVADDEGPARERLASLLTGRADVALVASCASGPSALAAMVESRPELAFLDVQMPGFNGLDVIRMLPANESPVVVFVTAFDQYAIAAFEAHALDYLLKPYTDERFTDSLQRAITSVQGRVMLGLEPRLRALLSSWPSDWQSALPASEVSSAGAERLAVRQDGSLHMVHTRSIRWISSDRDHVILHVANGVIRTRSTLGGFLRQLEAARFLQVSRSAVVNLAVVAELLRQALGDDVIVLQDGTRVPVSRRFRTAVRRRLRVNA